MPRARREDYPGAWHHVMNRGAAHNPVLASDADKHLLLDCLSDAVSRYSVEIHAYCLMSTHYHLLARSNEGRISDAMRFASAKFTRIKNNRDGRDGPLFRGRFKSVEIDTDAQLVQASRYIHLNPVEARLADKPWDWMWSSAASYIGLATCPSWLSTGTVLEMFGAVDPMKALQNHLRAGVDHSTRAFYLEQGL